MKSTANHFTALPGRYLVVAVLLCAQTVTAQIAGDGVSNGFKMKVRDDAGRHAVAVVTDTMPPTAVVSPAHRNTAMADILRDSVLADHKLVVVDPVQRKRKDGYTDSIRQMIDMFYYDQFRHFQDPDAPYFLFMSRDATLAMGIGGCVRMRGFYDWHGAMPGPGFSSFLIPMHPDPTAVRHFDTTPAGTCLFFRVIGRSKQFGNYQLYIEANFNGWQARDFRLKKAYAIINDFTIGYATSTFSDPAAVPPTVDAMGPNNKMSSTNVLIRWMPRVRDNWVFAVSAETPTTAVDADGTETKKVKEWMPDFAAFVQYEWGRTQHVRLSGILRTLSYRDMLASQNHNVEGWGLQLSTVSHPLYPLTVYGSANIGRGYAGLGGDLQAGSYDLIGDPRRTGRLYAPLSFGWNIALQYNFTPMLFVSTSVSHTRYLPDHAVSPAEYKYGIVGDVNVFWNMTARMQVGAEYDYGLRRDFDGRTRQAHRVGLMAQFSF